MRPYYSHAGITIFNGDWRDIEPPRAALVLADPPYGIKYKLNKGNAKKPKHYKRAHFPKIAGDDKPFDPRSLLAFETKTILWGANYYADKLPCFSSWLIWDKRDGIGSNDQTDCEIAWSNLGGPMRIFRHVWSGVIRASENGETHLHPSQKPVALMRWCLQRAKLMPGALVFDPFMGSGPVAKACKELGYQYIGCELVEQYCEITALGLQQEVMDLTEAF